MASEIQLRCWGYIDVHSKQGVLPKRSGFCSVDWWVPEKGELGSRRSRGSGSDIALH